MKYNKEKVICKRCGGSYEHPRPFLKCKDVLGTLYELAARVVDTLPLPPAMYWDMARVVYWMSYKLKLPQYREAMEKNEIDGTKLIELEEPSLLPSLNIHDFEHIKTICAGVRKLYGLEMTHYFRSISLPPRKPLTHYKLYRVPLGEGPSSRDAMTPSELFRRMQIIGPIPKKMNHWDYVWYLKPEFPKTLIGGSRRPKTGIKYVRRDDNCLEYQTPRKFKILPNVKPKHQFIWMEHEAGYDDNIQKTTFVRRWDFVQWQPINMLPRCRCRDFI